MEGSGKKRGWKDREKEILLLGGGEMSIPFGEGTSGKATEVNVGVDLDKGGTELEEGEIKGGLDAVEMLVEEVVVVEEGEQGSEKDLGNGVDVGKWKSGVEQSSGSGVHELVVQDGSCLVRGPSVVLSGDGRGEKEGSVSVKVMTEHLQTNEEEQGVKLRVEGGYVLPNAGIRVMNTNKFEVLSECKGGNDLDLRKDYCSDLGSSLVPNEVGTGGVK